MIRLHLIGEAAGAGGFTVILRDDLLKTVVIKDAAEGDNLGIVIGEEALKYARQHSATTVVRSEADFDRMIEEDDD
jgi:hypothetical protein